MSWQLRFLGVGVDQANAAHDAAALQRVACGAADQTAAADDADFHVKPLFSPIVVP